MKQEILESPELLQVKKDYELAGLPFSSFYEKAYNKAMDTIDKPVLEKVIRVVVIILNGWLKAESAKIPKTKAGKIWRWIYTFGGLFSSKS